MTSKIRSLQALWVFIILNYILKFYYINAWPISGDEPFTIFHAQAPWNLFLEMLANENNPPLYFLITKITILLTDTHSVWIRLPSVLFSICGVYFLFKIGLRYINLPAAIIASALYTFSSYLFLFSHETRAYSLFAMLTCAAFYSLLRIIEDKSNRSHSILLVIWNVCLIYTHFFGFFVLAIQGIYVLILSLKQKGLLKPFILVQCIVGVFYLPYFTILWKRFSQSASQGTWVNPPEGIQDLYFMLWTFFNSPIATIVSLLLFLSGYVFYIKKFARPTVENSDTLKSENQHPLFAIESNKNVRLFLLLNLWTWLPFIGMFLISFKVPLFLDRYLAYIVPGFYLLGAYMLSLILSEIKKKWVFAIVGIYLIVFIVDFKPRKEAGGRDSVRRIALLDEQVKKYPGSTVIVSPVWTKTLCMYFHRPDLFKQYVAFDSLSRQEGYYFINQEQISTVPMGDTLIYLSDWRSANPTEELIYKKISAEYKSIEEPKSFDKTAVFVFAKK